MTTDNEPRVVVTQAAREAAADLAGFLPDGGCVKGFMDNDKHVQAFAHFEVEVRIATEAACRARESIYLEAIEDVARRLDHIAEYHKRTQLAREAGSLAARLTKAIRLTEHPRAKSTTDATGEGK